MRKPSASVRRRVADAERAVRRHRDRSSQPREMASRIGRVTIPIDTTAPRVENELRVPWVLELTLCRGIVTCVRMIISTNLGKLGVVRGGAYDFSIPSLDEQIASIERQGRGARDRATVRVTLTAGHLGFRCGYAKIRQTYLVPRRAYEALLRVFRLARKQLKSAVLDSNARRIRRLPRGVVTFITDDEGRQIVCGSHDWDARRRTADDPCRPVTAATTRRRGTT